MLVSHSKKFIFLKTKKTAGSSVFNYLSKYCCEPGSILDPGNYYQSDIGIISGKSGPLGRHASATSVKEFVGSDIWNGYTKVVTIRNPFEKAISFYFFQKKRKGIAQQSLDLEKDSFRKFIRQSYSLIPRDLQWTHVDNIFSMDCLIRTESILSDLEIFCSKMNLDWEPVRLKSLKSGVRPIEATSSLFYDDETAEIVKMWLDEEFSLYGYPRNVHAI
jgi:hypothetical protein